MKIGDLEGSSEEIHDFFQNNGLKVEDYFQQPQKPIGKFWIVVFGLLVLVSLAMLVLEFSADPKVRKLIFIVSCFLSLCWSATFQVKFKNTWATSFVAIGCVLLALVAYGVYTPEDMFNAIQKLTNN
jgi:FtsH-binding integral membrane protein